MNNDLIVRRSLEFVGVCASMMIVIGCGKGRVATHPVRGSVVYNGRPVTVGTIIFSPMEAGLPAARGIIQPDGTFSLSTFQVNDGAAAGEHIVIVNSFTTPTAKPDLPADDPRQKMPTPLVPRQYTSIHDTPLRVTVENRENDVELALSD